MVNKLVNWLLDDLDASKLKTVFKKLSNIVSKEVVKNTKLTMLKTKVNKIDKKIPNATTLIYIIRYSTDKQNLEKKIGLECW